VFVLPEVDLCAPGEAGVFERLAERSDLQPPAALEPERRDEVGRRRELARERVPKRLEVLEDRRVVAVGERTDERAEEQSEQPAVQRVVLDAGVVPLGELVAVRDRKQQPGHEPRRVRRRVGVVDDDVLLGERPTESQPHVSALPAAAGDAAVGEQVGEPRPVTPQRLHVEVELVEPRGEGAGPIRRGAQRDDHPGGIDRLQRGKNAIRRERPVLAFRHRHHDRRPAGRRVGPMVGQRVKRRHALLYVLHHRIRGEATFKHTRYAELVFAVRAGRSGRPRVTLAQRAGCAAPPGTRPTAFSPAYTATRRASPAAAPRKTAS